MYLESDTANDRDGARMARSDWLSQVRRVDKPWGYEVHFALVDGRYCGKELHIDAGQALSLQYHDVKDETVFVQSGRLLFQIGKDVDELDEFELLPGEAIHISAGTIHRMTAIVDSVVLEASTTELSDVVRLEDRYGRAAT
jgi:quercetin dioxygenase-like cupin family protein